MNRENEWKDVNTVMLKPSMELTTDLKISTYSLAVGIAKRARRIAEDAEIRGEIMDDKPVDVAVEQYLNHEFRIVETEPCPVCGRIDCICGLQAAHEQAEEETDTETETETEAAEEAPSAETEA